MTQVVGPKGHIEIISSPVGAARKIRLLSFNGRATAGQCDNAMFRKDEAVVGVVNLSKGRVVTSSFAALTDTGNIVLTDTGGLGADGSFAATHELVAFVLTDTGTLG